MHQDFNLTTKVSEYTQLYQFNFTFSLYNGKWETLHVSLFWFPLDLFQTQISFKSKAAEVNLPWIHLTQTYKIDKFFFSNPMEITRIK